MTKMVAGHGESNQAELHCFPAAHPKTRTTCVEISGAMAKFPAKLGAQVGVGQIYYKEGLLRKNTTSFKKSWNEYILPRLVGCHLSAWIWCWWAWQDSLGCMKFTDCAPNLSKGFPAQVCPFPLDLGLGWLVQDPPRVARSYKRQNS